VTHVIRRGGLIPLVLVAVFAMTTAANAHSKVQDARIVGVVKVCGGRAPGGCRQFGSGRVRVVSASGRLVAVRPVKHGEFSLWLRPGRYTLGVVWGVDRAPLQPVVAVARRTKHVKIQIPVH